MEDVFLLTRGDIGFTWFGRTHVALVVSCDVEPLLVDSVLLG